MNTTRSYLALLFAAMFVVALTLGAILPLAHAQDPGATGAVAAATSTESTPLATYVSLAIAFVTGLIAIWKNNQATKAQKIVRSVVLGVEQATQLPEVRAAEEKIKATIKEKATAYGVQPLLHEIVKDLT